MTPISEHSILCKEAEKNMRKVYVIFAIFCSLLQICLAEDVQISNDHSQAVANFLERFKEHQQREYGLYC